MTDNSSSSNGLMNEVRKSLAKKHVLMLSPYYLPYRGGIENYTKNLSQALLQLDWDVSIFASSQGPTYHAQHNGRQVSGYRIDWAPMNNPVSMGMIPSLLRAQYDLLFVSGLYQTIALFGALTSTIRRKPSILAMHGRVVFDSFAARAFKCFYEATSALFLLRTFDNVIVTTRSDLAYMRELGYPEEHIHLIPNAVDVDFWAPNAGRSPDCSKDDGEYILFVGVLNKRKNCELLVRAFGMVHSSRQSLRLVIVGTGPLETYIRALVEKEGIGSRVVFLKDIDNVGLRSLYQNAKMLVLPSTMEGLSTVMLEAMASGTPVIASAIPGARDVIEHGINGFLFEPGSVSELANVIGYVLDSPEIACRVVRSARETVCEGFSWHRVGEQVADLMVQTLHL